MFFFLFWFFLIEKKSFDFVLTFFVCYTFLNLNWVKACNEQTRKKSSRHDFFVIERESVSIQIDRDWRSGQKQKGTNRLIDSLRIQNRNRDKKKSYPKLIKMECKIVVANRSKKEIIAIEYLSKLMRWIFQDRLKSFG